MALKPYYGMCVMYQRSGARAFQMTYHHHVWYSTDAVRVATTLILNIQRIAEWVSRNYLSFSPSFRQMCTHTQTHRHTDIHRHKHTSRTIQTHRHRGHGGHQRPLPSPLWRSRAGLDQGLLAKWVVSAHREDIILLLSLDWHSTVRGNIIHFTTFARIYTARAHTRTLTHTFTDTPHTRMYRET